MDWQRIADRINFSLPRMGALAGPSSPGRLNTRPQGSAVTLSPFRNPVRQALYLPVVVDVDSGLSGGRSCTRGERSGLDALVTHAGGRAEPGVFCRRNCLRPAHRTERQKISLNPIDGSDRPLGIHSLDASRQFIERVQIRLYRSDDNIGIGTLTIHNPTGL